MRGAIHEQLGELATAEPERAKELLRELGKGGTAVSSPAIEAFSAATPPARGRLCALVGRVAAAAKDERLVDFLLSALADPDPKTRRNSAIALGKLHHPRVEGGLVAALASEVDDSQRRVLVRSLGTVGSASSLAVLADLRAGDAETTRVVEEARLKLGRDAERAHESAIDGTRRSEVPLELAVHCRSGLEQLLAAELGSRFSASVASRALVSATLHGPPRSLFDARLMTSFGFVLPVGSAERSLEQTVVESITSERALEIFNTFTRGRIRYRLEWAEQGHQRGLTFRVARAVAERRPELVNDPTRSPWQVVVTRTDGPMRIELVPRGLADPRFTYRSRDVPAASHPTIAAALAQVGSAYERDVVWDPFVGSGLELVERGLLGPYAQLLGSDVSPDALDAAHANLSAARIGRFQLMKGDARAVRLPRSLDLVITNPPFGRRVRLEAELEPLYAKVLDRASQLLRPGGRMVWMSPFFSKTREYAERIGLSPKLARRIDMGGFQAELQLFVRA